MPRRAAAVEAAKNISHIRNDEDETEDTIDEGIEKNEDRLEEMEIGAKIAELCSITGSSKEEASNFLSACNGSLNMAIEMFTEDTDIEMVNQSNMQKSSEQRKRKQGLNEDLTKKNKSSDKWHKNKLTKSKEMDGKLSDNGKEGTSSDVIQKATSKIRSNNRKKGKPTFSPESDKDEDSESDWENLAESSESSDNESNDSSNESETETNDNKSQIKHRKGEYRKRQKRLKREPKSHATKIETDSKRKRRKPSCSTEEDESDAEYERHSDVSNTESEDTSEEDESDEDSSIDLTSSGTKSRPQRSKTVKNLTDVLMSEEESLNFKPKRKRRGKSKAFSGKGHLLGGRDSAPVELPTPVIDSSVDYIQKAKDELKVDDSKDKASVQLRFPDGQSIKLNINHIHTVGNLKQFVHTAKPELHKNSFTLRTSFPNKELNDDSVTMKDGGLVGAAIFLKFI